MLNIKKINKGLNFLEKIETSFVIIIMVFIFLINFLDIICRYFLFGSLGWPQEVSTQLIIWVTYFGVSILVKKNTLINVDIFYNKFSETTRKIIALVRDMIILILFIYLIRYFFELAKIQSMRYLVTLNIAQSIGTYGAIIAVFLTIPIQVIKIYNDIF